MKHQFEIDDRSRSYFGNGIKKWNPKWCFTSRQKRKGTHITNLARPTCFLSKACSLVFNATSQEKRLLIVDAKEE